MQLLLGEAGVLTRCAYALTYGPMAIGNPGLVIRQVAHSTNALGSVNLSQLNTFSFL